ncbi:MAG TPA: glutamine synthetase type III, partial [Lachnospiraceae bacterium]|nr:glutamine synthetase type III [Lachnospiraceae bacterium]
IKMFEKFGIFTKAELESRAEILYETYAKSINIEALTMIDMASKQIIPSVISYTGVLADTVLAVKQAGASTKVQSDLLKKTTALLEEMQEALAKLEKDAAKAMTIADEKKRAFYYKDTVMIDMQALRDPADQLEMLVDKKMWPYPTYADMLFEV